MEHRTKYKALVLKKRSHDGSHIFCHIGWKPGNKPEFVHTSMLSLLSTNSTLEDYASNYKPVATELFMSQFLEWHELVDCELVIKDATASPIETSL